VASRKIISITSNEPAENTKLANSDWQITGDLTLNLRAEHSANGAGRIYTITIECVDDSENISTAVTQVTVRHSLGDTPSSRPVIARPFHESDKD
jgi:hypothetical protein